MEAKKNFVINAAFYAIAAAIVILTYKYILPYLIPFIIAFCVATIVQVPLMHLKLKNTALHNGAAIILCLAFYAGLIWLLILFGVKVYAEIRSFALTLPDLFQNELYPFFLHVADQLQHVLEPIEPAVYDWLLEAGKTIAAKLGQFATEFSAGAVKLVASGAISIPGILVQVIVTVVASFYMSADDRTVLNFLKGLIPEKHRQFVVQMLRYAEKAVLAYIKSYSIMFIITFLELWIGLSLLKLPYALGLSFGIAVFDLMPILGVGGILLPWSLIALVMGNYPMALGVLLLYLVIAAVRNTLEPRIVGNHIGLHPLATLVAMMVGLGLAGLVGMMLLPVSLVALVNLKKTTQSAQESAST